MTKTAALWRGDLPLRLGTAVVGIPVLVALIVVGGWPFDLVLAALLAIGTQELMRAAGVPRRDPLTWLSALAAGALALEHWSGGDLRPITLTVLVMLTLALSVVRGEVEHGFTRWSVAVAAAVYVGVLGSFLSQLRHLDDGAAWVFVLLFTTFATDTGAYVVGRLFGRTKLAPRVSPGKTRAGAYGGAAAAALTALALNAALGLDRPPVAMALLGLAVAVVAQFGDLGESLLKRGLGVKDMGRLFPGHGGALDRLDSILFVAPVVYSIARWVLT